MQHGGVWLPAESKHPIPVKTSLVILLACLALSGLRAREADALQREIAASTLIRPGDSAPDFACRTTDGRDFSLSQQKGRVVLLYFFASSVPFCYPEMRYIEQEIVKKLEQRGDFAVLCLARGHTREEVVRIGGENKLRLPMAADETKSIYQKMFTKFVPRVVLVGKDGRIAYTATGSREFEGILRLQQAVSEELRR